LAGLSWLAVVAITGCMPDGSAPVTLKPRLHDSELVSRLVDGQIPPDDAGAGLLLLLLLLLLLGGGDGVGLLLLLGGGRDWRYKESCVSIGFG
jgi:hypothetical protein